MLSQAEDAKVKKHARRVAVAENADFLPFICSKQGTLAFQSQQFLKTCTEKILGESTGDAEAARALHLNRARMQAAIWRATSLCIVGRKGDKAAKAAKARAKEEKEAQRARELPLWCVSADALF